MGVTIEKKTQVRREPRKERWLSGWGREAASTLKFFHFTVLPKAEEYKFALCVLLVWRNSKTIPNALELITADDGHSCKYMRKRQKQPSFQKRI